METRKKGKYYYVLFGGLAAVLAVSCYSVTQGSIRIPLSTIREAIVQFDAQNKYHLILMDHRLPRIIAGLLVGASLSVAGAIMQGMTRNPMADSGLMGLNAGAGFALSICFAFFSGLSYLQKIFFCFAGAALSAVFVNGITTLRREKETAFNMVIIGAAVSALLTGLSQGIALCFNVSQSITFWTMGGVSAADWNQIRIMTPIIVGALFFSVMTARQITLLSLGEEVAQGLGLNCRKYRRILSLLVVILAGISVSVVGAVGFVGLIVPHIVRFLVGVDYRHIIPASAVFGALLMVAADLAARSINPPFETPVGVLTSLIGVPFFLYLARKQRRGMG